jgi:hypothetical protein
MHEKGSYPGNYRAAGGGIMARKRKKQAAYSTDLSRTVFASQAYDWVNCEA